MTHPTVIEELESLLKQTRLESTADHDWRSESAEMFAQLKDAEGENVAYFDSGDALVDERNVKFTIAARHTMPALLRCAKAAALIKDPATDTPEARTELEDALRLLQFDAARAKPTPAPPAGKLELLFPEEDWRSEADDGATTLGLREWRQAQWGFAYEEAVADNTLDELMAPSAANRPHP